MRKIKKISELQPTIAFTEFDIFRDYGQSFLTSELGKIYQLLPFAALAKSLKLKESALGRASYFSPAGKIALMLLKSYTGLSDQDLIAQLNANIHFQIFCGVRINPLSPLSNFKIVSEIRCELGKKLNIDSSQQVLADYWKPYLEHTSVMMTDATCYESAIRFPTDVKILWESVDWIYRQLKIIVKSLKGRMPRSKYDKQSRRYHSYCKKRKRKESETRVLKRSLLHLLDKLIGVLGKTIRSNGSRLELSSLFHKRLSIIKKVLQQQTIRFQGGEVKGLIVSIDKDYIRPIVRGKESKRVTHLAADGIYATNYNRTYCSNPTRKITTSFIRKGRASKNEAQAQQMRNLLNRERSTRLEGSFGTEKQHYSLDKIKARTKPTETLWIFFGIHTANAVRMISKVEKVRKKQAV